jgi:hypothetical protein
MTHCISCFFVISRLRGGVKIRRSYRPLFMPSAEKNSIRPNNSDLIIKTGVLHRMKNLMQNNIIISTEQTTKSNWRPLFEWDLQGIYLNQSIPMRLCQVANNFVLNHKQLSFYANLVLRFKSKISVNKYLKANNVSLPKNICILVSLLPKD